MPMASRTVAPELTLAQSRSRRDLIPIMVIAMAIAIAHLLTNQRYGFHRDELQSLSDALHLDWGFVPYPPLTPSLERISLGVFGLSMVGLRLFSVIAQSTAIFVTGVMARELGGGRLALVAAALGVATAPLSLFEGTEFQYTTFDYLWWVLAAYFVIRLLKSDDPRWCVPLGAVLGIGLLTKYTMFFYIAGLLAGFLLTSARGFLRSRWFWIGAALALLIFLPNLIWQVRHDFISLTFLRHIHTRDVGEGRAAGYWSGQFLGNANPLAAPLWIAGLIGFLWNARFRTLAWMYLIPVLILWAAKGRDYYPGAAYPMLMAMGAVVIERRLRSLRQPWRRTAEAAYLLALLGGGVYASSIILPLSSNGPLRDRALKDN